MGSSGGGGTSRQPQMPVPQGTQVPYGQTSSEMQPQMSYLPTDPNAVATGLTPQMMSVINAPPPPPPPQAAAAGAMDQNAMRTMLAQMMAQQRERRHPLIAGILDQIGGRGPGYGQGISRGGGDRGSGGGGSAQGGRGGFGGSSARGGGLY